MQPHHFQDFSEIRVDAVITIIGIIRVSFIALNFFEETDNE